MAADWQCSLPYNLTSWPRAREEQRPATDLVTPSAKNRPELDAVAASRDRRENFAERRVADA